MPELFDHAPCAAWVAPVAPLPPRAVRWLRARTGLAETSTPAAPESLRAVPDSALPGDAHAALVATVGAKHVPMDRAARLDHATGLSYLDLLRGAGELAVPDVVVFPVDPDQVTEVLAECARAGVAVVPFGGGTSVVGGVAADRGDKAAVLALDLARLDR